MRVALFGGAFDPPHIGHQRIAQTMIEHKLADEVWYVPVYEHPWAERLDKWEMAAYDDRLKMVELILDDHTYLREYPKLSLAYPTLLQFAKNYPTDDFSWIIGADNLSDFTDWDCYQQILEEFGVHVYPRAGFELKTDLPGMNLLTACKKVVASSTEIKQRLRSGQKVEQFLDPRVLKYIQDHDLYQ